MTTPIAARRSTFVGWLLIFLAVVAVVVGISANAVKGSAGSETLPIESPNSFESGEDPLAPTRTRLVPQGVTDTPTEQNAASTDQNDPSRFRIVADGVLEDAATGIRRQVDGVKSGQSAPSADAIREFNSVNSDLRSDLSVGSDPEPARLIVDSIRVDAEVVPIGLDQNKALAVPRRADITGWWSGGYRPGEFGPTVIVGHYDSKVAPGVFARLKDVEELDLITVVQTNGAKYFYEVEFVERLHKTEFPTETVYGPTDGSTLRLVTCGGKFDPKTRHYVDNVIVYASLIRTEGVPDPGLVGGRSSAFGPDSRDSPNLPPNGVSSADAGADTSVSVGAPSTVLPTNDPTSGPLSVISTTTSTLGTIPSPSGSPVASPTTSLVPEVPSSTSSTVATPSTSTIPTAEIPVTVTTAADTRPPISDTVIEPVTSAI